MKHNNNIEKNADLLSWNNRFRTPLKWNETTEMKQFDFP